MTRLFVAAWPPPAAAAVLSRLPALDEPGVRRVPAGSWHVTVRFLGEADAGTVIERLGGAELPAAVARLGPRVVALGGRQLVVPVAGVDRLAAAVRTATAGLGEPDRHRFTGHLTVAHRRPGVASRLAGVPVAGAAVGGGAGESMVEFEVVEVALVASELRQQGARYETVATFPTRAA